MRVVLCHSCWSWANVESDRCSECQARVALDEPDPPYHAMARVLGEPVCRFGSVALERSHLPSSGRLYGLEFGLLFLPSLRRLDDGSMVPLRSPVEDSGWSWRRLWNRGRRDDATGEAHLSESLAVVDHFFDTPGALFCPVSDVVDVGLKGRRWQLQRRHGRGLRLTITASPEVWKPAWRQLARVSDDWRLRIPPLD